MRWLRLIIIIVCIFSHFNGNACTIVAVSGSATADGRPLLMKNRDSSAWDLRIKIGGGGSNYVYLCQCNVPNGSAYSGFNETGFAIISSHSYNMPNTDYGWNAYIMQLALERCASVNEFDSLLNALTKPISVCSNYGVMDAQGNVAIFEVSAYTYARYNVDSSCNGYLIRTNYSFSGDTTIIHSVTTSSVPRYQISSDYMSNTIAANGFITKENLLELSRCLIDSVGVDLRNSAPFDEFAYTPVDFRYYVPGYSSTSAMVIQGVLPNEDPLLTVAWTALGPPLSTVTIPYLITPQRYLPQKSQMDSTGHSWLVSNGQQLKNRYFINSNTIDLAKLYNQAHTGVMQKIVEIEEELINRGDAIVDSLRIEEVSSINVANYYSWVDEYLEQQYCPFFNDTCDIGQISADTVFVHDTVYIEVFIHDTIFVTDTVFIHDTVYVQVNEINDIGAENIILYQNNGQIVVEKDGEGVLPQVSVFDVLGRQVLSCVYEEPTKKRFIVPLSGTYIVNVGGRKSYKIVVMK